MKVERVCKSSRGLKGWDAGEIEKALPYDNLHTALPRAKDL